jgi:hypothetical protein
MLTSIPDMSGKSLATASQAVSGEQVPICKINLGTSSGRMLKTKE